MCVDVKLARAVLLFYSSPHWTIYEQEEWESITNSDKCNSLVLIELAREVLMKASKHD